MGAVSQNEARSRLILALDVPDLGSGLAVLEKVGSSVGMVKVGLELFVAEGPRAVTAIKECGFEVFLDLKLHDIPNTVAGAVRSARCLGASMLTVHAAGGREMLGRAVEAAGDELRILAVTLLTSLGDEDLSELAIAGDILSVVRARADVASRAGCGGIVCSPREIRLVRENVPADVRIITPGIRSATEAQGDQKRIATPAIAVASGADYLVVGRPITAAADPRQAAESIVDEIAGALS